MTGLAHATPARDDQGHRAGGPASSLLAHTVVSRLPSSGAPLPAAAQRMLEHEVGRDLSTVRVHRDAYAEVTTQRFGAHALTAGRDVLLGTGKRRMDTEAGGGVLAHEVWHAASQARTGIAVVELDAIDQAEDLLSYGFLDWAITDADAMEALALLNSLDDAALPGGLVRLGSEYVNRMLDNLPDAARSGPAYTRVVQALGAAGTVGDAVGQLSYGLFDWAITDTEVTRVYNTFVNLQPAQQEPFLVGLNGVGRLGRLVSNSNAGHLSLYLHPWIRSLTRGGLTAQQRPLLRAIISATDDLPTLTLATETRFNLAVGPSAAGRGTAVPWQPDRLRETYLTLDLLPEAHVVRNRELLRLGQFTEPVSGNQVTAGFYQSLSMELAINTTETTGDREETVRHETGHAVDRAIAWSTGPEPATVARGGWKNYGANHAATAGDMVIDAAAGVSRLTAPQRSDVVNEMATAMVNLSTEGLTARVRGLPWYGGLTAQTKKDVVEDPSFEAIKVGFELQAPWFKPDGGMTLAIHHYQESYNPYWVRYKHEARTRRVSEYQFRDPGEWFAEAYAWYYAPDPRGKGMKLADKDPDTKNWFDRNVDTAPATRP